MTEIESEFNQILLKIKDQNWSSKDWAEHESCDWFQTKHFCGGFEADETYENGAFTFSYYDQTNKEWWFVFEFSEFENILKNGFSSVKLFEPLK